MPRGLSLLLFLGFCTLSQGIFLKLATAQVTFVESAESISFQIAPVTSPQIGQSSISQVTPTFSDVPSNLWVSEYIQPVLASINTLKKISKSEREPSAFTECHIYDDILTTIPDAAPSIISQCPDVLDPSEVSDSLANNPDFLDASEIPAIS